MSLSLELVWTRVGNHRRSSTPFDAPRRTTPASAMDERRVQDKLDATICAAYRVCGTVQYVLESKLRLDDNVLSAVPLLLPVGLWSLWKLYLSNRGVYLTISVLLYTSLVCFFVWYERKRPKRRTTCDRRRISSATVELETPPWDEGTSKSKERAFQSDQRLDEELVVREAQRELHVLCETIGIAPPSPLQPVSTQEQVEKLLREISRVCRAIGISKPPDTELLEEVWEYIQTINAFVGLRTLRK